MSEAEGKASLNAHYTLFSEVNNWLTYGDGIVNGIFRSASLCVSLSHSFTDSFSFSVLSVCCV